MSDWLDGPLVASDQSPGPRKGTSTSASGGLRLPASAPCSALALPTAVTGRAIESVTFEEFATADRVLTFDVGRFVVVVFTIVGTSVVAATRTDVVVEGGFVFADWWGLDAEVRVKTRMSRRIGLDHVKRCALFSEKGVRGIVFEG